LTPSERFTSDAKHLERIAAWLYDRARNSGLPGLSDDAYTALTAHQTADTLDKLARDLREYAALYAGRIP
jgi:hypothetical protein